MAYRKRHPDAEARRVEALRRALRKPETRERMAAAARKRFCDPKQREQIANARRSWLADPKNREDCSKVLQAARAARGPGRAGGLSGSAEYKVWGSLVQRCTNPKSTGWGDYGGRGIAVCAAWRGPGGFVAFYDHVGPRPSSQHTIGRIDNDGHYEPGNVRWDTRTEQMKNWSRNRLITIGNVTKHAADWARDVGLTAPAFVGRLARGWPMERLLDPPHATGRRAKD